MLIDSHCHLDYPALASDRDGVLARAAEAGVGRFINISTTRTDFPAVLATAEAYGQVYCSVGAHPHHVEEAGQDFDEAELIDHAMHPKVVGIGETGLDYFYEHSPRAMQQASFRKHLRACKASGLPVIVHTRDADADTAAILQDEGAGQGMLHGVLHCFSSGRALAEAAIAMGFYISLSGILTFKKSDELRAIVKDVPLDRLLVETDSPFLAPMPHRGKPCEPAYIRHTAQLLAELKGISAEELARTTTVNAMRLFLKMAHSA